GVGSGAGAGSSGTSSPSPASAATWAFDMKRPVTGSRGGIVRFLPPPRDERRFFLRRAISLSFLLGPIIDEDPAFLRREPRGPSVRPGVIILRPGSPPWSPWTRPWPRPWPARRSP